METHSISEYLLFGETVEFLKQAKIGTDVHEYVIYFLNEFFIYLDTYNFTVTKNATYTLEQFKDELEKTDSDHKLSKNESEKLNELMNEVFNVLYAEAQGKITYTITDKRMDVNKLLSDVPALLALKVFNLLPGIARYDLIEAGKCTAFERPTAAAFHLLRGTEGVLRKLYCDIVKRKRVDPLLWGPIIRHLKNRKKNRLDDALLKNLDNIRENYRNPTQHPDEIYDIDRSQDLWGLCTAVINQMVQSKHWISSST